MVLLLLLSPVVPDLGVVQASLLRLVLVNLDLFQEEQLAFESALVDLAVLVPDVDRQLLKQFDKVSPTHLVLRLQVQVGSQVLVRRGDHDVHFGPDVVRLDAENQVIMVLDMVQNRPGTREVVFDFLIVHGFLSVVQVLLAKVYYFQVFKSIKVLVLRSGDLFTNCLAKSLEGYPKA
jgi:hypothetical protein